MYGILPFLLFSPVTVNAICASVANGIYKPVRIFSKLCFNPNKIIWL
jgi:hypothetical protein